VQHRSFSAVFGFICRSATYHAEYIKHFGGDLAAPLPVCLFFFFCAVRVLGVLVGDATRREATGMKGQFLLDWLQVIKAQKSFFGLDE
jgi:hypothetical protein